MTPLLKKSQAKTAKNVMLRNRISDSSTICLDCKNTFENIRDYNHHFCHGSITLICDVCQQQFRDKSRLTLHVLTHISTREAQEYCCEFCGELFTSLKKQQLHKMKKHDSFQNCCDKCHKHFSSEKLLARHNCRTYICQECGSTFKRKLSLAKHLKIHLEESELNLKCVYCSCVFTDEISYRSHLSKMDCSESARREWLDNYPNTLCRSCHHQFPSEMELVSHFSTWHQGLPYKCFWCERELESYNQLVKHIKLHSSLSSQDKNENPQDLLDSSHLKCNYCKSRFLCLNSHAEHMKNCRKNSKVECHVNLLESSEATQYSCEKCKKSFLSDKVLANHQCRTYSCQECGMVYPTKYLLSKHLKHHSKESTPNFKCKYCSVLMTKEQTYLQHMSKLNCSKSARNAWLDNYTATICRCCQQNFGSEEELSSHFSFWHQGKLHQCFWCERQFQRYSDLVEHVNYHNTYKFSCSFCGKQYTSHEGYRKHRIKHSNTQLQCQFCQTKFLLPNRLAKHVEKCKKDPERGYVPLLVGKQPDGRVIQRRQLQWESRIIVKKVRGEVQSGGKSLEDLDGSFFNEDGSNSPLSDRQGWFDDYYRTEEDEKTFGVMDSGISEVRSEVDNSEMLPPPASPSEGVGSSADDSSEDERIEIGTQIDFNAKQCRVCDNSYSQEYELIHHFIKAHSGTLPHKCPHCEHTSPLFAQLKEHMKIHGIGLDVHNCGNCSKAFRSEQRLKTHYTKCIGEVDTKSLGDTCRRCGKVYQTKCGYKRHKSICKGEKKSKPECKEQKEMENYNVEESEQFETEEPQTDFVIDMDFVESPKEPPKAEENVVQKEDDDDVKKIMEPPKDSFPCRLCPEKFQFERGLVMHFKKQHPLEKPLICHVCGLLLADKLKEHLKTHGIGEEFVCELCGKRFNQKFVGKIHELWHQGIEYKCENCKQKFLNKVKMEKHISEARCKNRLSLMRLPCDVCGKFYRSKFGLNNHYLTHTPRDLRPMRNRMNCEFCGKWFESNNGLQRHRRIHTGEKPYCCRFCPKTFAQEGNCKAHERIHTGESRPRKKKPPKLDVPNVIAAGYQPTQLVFNPVGSGFIH